MSSNESDDLWTYYPLKTSMKHGSANESLIYWTMGEMKRRSRSQQSTATTSILQPRLFERLIYWAMT